MEPTEPQLISPGVRVLAAVFTMVAVGVMVGMLLYPDRLAVSLGKGEAMDMAFTPVGEMGARSLSQFRGRVLVVSLWRTGDCPECPAQLTALHELAARYGREGLLSIVLSDEDPATIANSPSLRSMSVMAGRIARVQADVLPKERPYTYLFDRSGVVRKKFAKSQSVGRLEPLVESLLGN